MAFSSIMTQSLLSASSSMRIARVQNSTKNQMEGQARVLDSEIRLDSARGADVTKKKEELEETQKKANELAETAISTLSLANDNLKKAAKDDQEEQRAQKAAEKKKSEKVAEKKKAEKKAKEERIEKDVEISTPEDDKATVGQVFSTEGALSNSATISLSSEGVPISTDKVLEPTGNNVDIKI